MPSRPSVSPDAASSRRANSRLSEERSESGRAASMRRRQDWKHGLPEERTERRLMGTIDLGPGDDPHASPDQRRHQLTQHELIQDLHQRVHAFADGSELLCGCQAREVWRFVTVGDVAVKARDPDHEEFVEVRRDDGSELDPLEEGIGPIGRFFQHSLVEGQPRQFAVDEQIGAWRSNACQDCAPVGRMMSSRPKVPNISARLRFQDHSIVSRLRAISRIQVRSRRSSRTSRTFCRCSASSAFVSRRIAASLLTIRRSRRSSAT